MSKYVPKDMEWFLADIIQVFTFANGDSPLTWINTHLLKATTPEEAYTKAVALGELHNDTYMNPDGVEVTSTFRGLRDLLLIYEKLEDGAEILWTEYDDLNEDQINAMISTKESLGAFVVHNDESKVTRESEEKDDEEGRESVESLNSAAQVQRDIEQLESSAAIYEQSLRTLRKLSRPSELAFTLRHAGDVHSQIGQLDLAEREIKEAIHIYSNTLYTSPLDLANCTRLLAITRERQAQEAWHKAMELYSDLKIQLGVDEAHRHLALGDQK